MSGRFLIFKKLRHYALCCSRIKLKGQMAIKEPKFIAGLCCWPPVGTSAYKSWEGSPGRKLHHLPFEVSSMGKALPFVVPGAPTRAGKANGSQKGKAYQLPFIASPMGKLVPFVSGAPTGTGRADGSQERRT